MVRCSRGRNLWIGLALSIPLVACSGNDSTNGAGATGLGGNTSTTTASVTSTSSASGGGMGGATTSSMSSSSAASSGGGGAASSSGTGGASASSGQGGAGGTGGASASSGQGGMAPTCMSVMDCPAAPNECVVVTCVGGFCGKANVADGTQTAAQTLGDCKATECDGAGAIKTVNLDVDVPGDGNPCTDDTCSGGVGSNTPSASGTSCGQALVCDGNGACVGCVKPSDCGADTDCQQHTCAANQCGIANQPAGTVAATQTIGDCQVNQCDGAGAVMSVEDDNDLPVDNHACTADVCTQGVPSNPGLPVETPCMENGGSFCDANGVCAVCVSDADCGAGHCVGSICVSCTDGLKNGLESDVDCGGAQCPACPLGKACGAGADCSSGSCNGSVCQSPIVLATTPADGATGVPASSSVALTFSGAMDPATLGAQTSTGACSGTIQMSTDNFATCIGFAAIAPTMSGGNTIATLTPAPFLSYGTTFLVKATGAATDAAADPLVPYLSAAGITTAVPPAPCDGSVVISQIYGGGGNAGATYKNDFVELHNRGNTTVSLVGWSVQYASSAGNSWSNAKTPLTGSIAPGGYYLVWEAGGAVGLDLPAADATGSVNMSATAGKVALVSNNVALVGNCPVGNGIVDFVGFGVAADCHEGTGNTPAPSNTLAVQRATAGCKDSNDNKTDFAAATPAPRDALTPANVCAANVCGARTMNETDLPTEADFCNVQFPTSLTVAASQVSDVVYGRVYEAGVTDPPGADATIVAQLGFGPPDKNPESQAGWQFFPASFNVQVGNDDEYMATFTAPAVAGTYSYTYRFSINGVDWTYCDLNGAGSNAGLSFETTQLPILTVTP